MPSQNQKVNDENQQPAGHGYPTDRPSDEDRARFGFKFRAPLTGSGSITTPNSNENILHEAPSPKPPVVEIPAASFDVATVLDVKRIISHSLGDDFEEETQRVLKLKPTAGKYEFKDRIADLEAMIKPLKHAVAEQHRKVGNLVEELQGAERAVQLHFQAAYVEITSQKEAIREAAADLATSRKEAAERAASQRQLRSQIEDLKREAAACRESESAEARRAASLNARLTEALSEIEGLRAETKRQETIVSESHAQAELAREECRAKTLEAQGLLRKHIEASKQCTDELLESFASKETKIAAERDSALERCQAIHKEWEQILEREREAHLRQLDDAANASEEKLDSLKVSHQQELVKFEEAMRQEANSHEESITEILARTAAKEEQSKLEVKALCLKHQEQLLQKEEELRLRDTHSTSCLEAVKKMNQVQLEEKDRECLHKQSQKEAEFRELMESMRVIHAQQLEEKERLMADKEDCAKESLESLKVIHQAQITNFEQMLQQKESDIRDLKLWHQTELENKDTLMKQKELDASESMARMQRMHEDQLREKDALLKRKDLDAAESCSSVKAMHQAELKLMEQRLSQKDADCVDSIESIERLHQTKLDEKEELLKQKDEGFENLKRTHQMQLDQKDELLQQKDSHLRESLQSIKLLQASNSEQLQFERLRIQKLEAEVQNCHALEDELRKHQTAVSKNADQLQMELSFERDHSQNLKASLQRLELEKELQIEKSSEKQAALQEEITSLKVKLAMVKEELSSRSELAKAKSAEVEGLKAQRDSLEVEFRSYKDHHGTSNQQQMEAITELRLTVDKLSKKVEATSSELTTQQHNFSQQQGYIQSLEHQLASAESIRRELHNTIQELKGNIRVFCRVRPAIDCGEPALQSLEANKLSLTFARDKHDFNFDRVFDVRSTQEDIFDEVSGLVQSALDGYKVCIFAYGQTGSGKTFTMQGMSEPSTWGLIPRSLSKIFQTSEAMRASGWEWTLRASFLEVYNEAFRDLLSDGKDNSSPPVHVIKHDDAWGAVVTNLSNVEVRSLDQITRLMEKASKQRAVGATDMNAISSRSHSVFALYLHGLNRELNSELHGALHLVDLAGSERLDRSGATGDRLKETQNINRSLSSLADVFLAKSENRSHIPFRNSKLTHLMEPCLNGHGKTLMVVNVGPEQENAHETLCSLRFAGQVSQCNTGGKPKRSKGPAGPCLPSAVATPLRSQSNLRAATTASSTSLSSTNSSIRRR